TQPLPNPLSWYFHNFPKLLHRIETLFNHFVELVVPWFYFSPRIFCYIAGALTLIFQFALILSGNLSWLNYITIVLAIFCFDDKFFLRFSPSLSSFQLSKPLSTVHEVLIGALALFIAYLSYGPAKNLFSPRQMMNASFDNFHLVNTYGAFGSITK